MSNILAIDLGTSFITSAYFKNQMSKVIVRLPSVIQFGCMGNVLVGEEALNRKIGNRENTVDSIKRFIGKSFAEIEKETYKYTFGILAGKDSELLIDTFYSVEKPAQIISLLLKEIKEKSEQKTGVIFNQVVLTVPASFTSTQRKILKTSAESIGFEVLKIINEPTAAVLEYLYGSGLTSEQFAVYNFGGGMFDFSIVDFNLPNLKILSTYGDAQLGGIDLVGKMIHLIIAKFQVQEGIFINIEKSLILKAELHQVAIDAVHELSTKNQTLVNIQSAAQNSKFELVDMNLIITRADFEEAIEPVIEQTIGFMKKCLDDAKPKLKNLSKVLLIGGSSKIPLVKRKISSFLINYYHTNQGFFKHIPQIQDFHNSDEIVAKGAGIQAGILAGKLDLFIKDIVTRELGITVYPNLFSSIITKGVSLPASRNNVYTTVYDYQRELEVEVLQGGKKLAKENDCLGKFKLNDIEFAKAGKPEIRVNFNIDENGIFSVSAQDLKTGSYKDMLVEQATWKL